MASPHQSFISSQIITVESSAGYKNNYLRITKYKQFQADWNGGQNLRKVLYISERFLLLLLLFSSSFDTKMGLVLRLLSFDKPQNIQGIRLSSLEHRKIWLLSTGQWGRSSFWLLAWCSICLGWQVRSRSTLLGCQWQGCHQTPQIKRQVSA